MVQKWPTAKIAEQIKAQKEWERALSARSAVHNVDLEVLAEDQDERFQPCAALVALVKANEFGVYRTLDRPLVPVLNALVGKGLEPSSRALTSRS
jgi:hypothetical protein